MLDDDKWLTKWIWYKKCGKPPIDYEDFTEKHMIALLHHMDKVVEDRTALAMEAGVGNDIESLSMGDLRDIEAAITSQNEATIAGASGDKAKKEKLREILRNAAAANAGQGLSSKRWGPPRNLKTPTSWDEAVLTGDSVVDAWETAIAEGREPDFGGIE